MQERQLTKDVVLSVITAKISEIQGIIPLYGEVAVAVTLHDGKIAKVQVSKMET